MSKEIHHLLTMGIDGVVEFDDSQAVLARVLEWLDTPIGQVWGAPHWGHNLTQYKHDPINVNTAVAIESSIVSKLPVDVSGVSINGISVTPANNDIDTFLIKIGINGTVITKGVSFE